MVRATRMGFGGVAVACAIAFSGCSTVTAEGRVVDGLTGQPIPGPYRMKAKAVSAADVAMSCQYFDAEVTAEGTFKLDRLCPGTAYKLETDNEELWLVEVDEIPDGGFGQPTDVTAWRMPKGSGVYKLSNGALTLLKTDSDVEVDKIFGTSETVRLPNTIPDSIPLIGSDDYLVLVGKSTVADMKLSPLVESGPRKFGDAAEPYNRPETWWYLGTKFTDDTTFERVTANLDATKVIDKTKGERHGRYISGGALAKGRYALLKDDDKRMYLLDFGAAPAPTAAPAVAPEEPAAP